MTQIAAAEQQVLRLSASAASSAAVDLQAKFASGLVAADLSAALHAAALPAASVATLSYQFFTGQTPGAAGMDYLLAADGPNPNNLNGGYYQAFNLENRYINFSVNLGKAGAGASSFQAAYGGLSLLAATEKAYGVIFGVAADDTKAHTLLDTLVTTSGGSESRAQYFADLGGDASSGLGTKAAMVGWLLAEAAKADVGAYAKANDAYLDAVALHGAALGVDLIGVYDQSVYHTLAG